MIPHHSTSGHALRNHMFLSFRLTGSISFSGWEKLMQYKWESIEKFVYFKAPQVYFRDHKKRCWPIASLLILCDWDNLSAGLPSKFWSWKRNAIYKYQERYIKLNGNFVTPNIECIVVLYRYYKVIWNIYLDWNGDKVYSHFIIKGSKLPVIICLPS